MASCCSYTCQPLNVVKTHYCVITFLRMVSSVKKTCLNQSNVLWLRLIYSRTMVTAVEPLLVVIDLETTGLPLVRR